MQAFAGNEGFWGIWSKTVESIVLVFVGTTRCETQAGGVSQRSLGVACLLVTATDPSEPVRKLPFVEKQNRLEMQKRRISGLSHRPEQQPAHQLIDQVYNLIESGAIIYTHPSKCHSREHEIQNEAKQKTKQIVTLEQGSLKTTTANAMTDIDTSTELKICFVATALGF